MYAADGASTRRPPPQHAISDRCGPLRDRSRRVCAQLAAFVAGEADGALSPRRFDRVVSIDKSGPDTATIKLHVGSVGVAGQDRLITDFLMLVRCAGGWRIVTRIYTPRQMVLADGE